MMNFLDPVFHPKVHCDKNSTDDYEIYNLISNDFMKKNRGFLAYSTVKPPVEIDFEIICPISIDYVLINSTVGNHKCLGIEIFARSTGQYHSIGKAVYDKNGVVFCSSTKYVNGSLPSNIPKSYHICFLKRLGFVTYNTKFLKIRIFKTGKFVPCLSSVEIWGTVSNKCSDVTKNTIQRLCQKSENISKDFSSLLSCPNSNSDEENSRKNCEIPDDFKDDLTFEIMTIPMTLPSGKTIDQSTLEKHIESEKTFGRKAGDPFTGLKFTETFKPVLNVALKSRIDMYLLQNSSDPKFFNLHRSIGHGSKQNFNIDPETSVKIVKKIKLDNEEIIFDESKLKFKEFIEENINSCSSCKNNQNLYRLPCKHLYCRKCVNEICTELACRKCSKAFSRSDIGRIHCQIHK